MNVEIDTTNVLSAKYRQIIAVFIISVFYISPVKYYV